MEESTWENDSVYESFHFLWKVWDGNIHVVSEREYLWI